MKRILSVFLILIIVSCAFYGCGETNLPDTGTVTVSTSETSVEKMITITVDVVDDKGETTSFPITTDSENLRGALEQENLVSGEEGPYGLYIKTVNGITADYDVDSSYWGFYKDGEYLSTSVDDTIISDGEHYEIVYTK